MFKVSEVAHMAGISVRTLHHYDHIGLLCPESITDSGYRLYSDSELEKLQHILFLKELDFPLKDIGEILSSPKFDREEALERQRTLLLKKRDRLNKLINTIDLTFTSRKEGKTMSKKEMFENFDMKEIEEHQKMYADEVKEKYGTSDTFSESQMKTEKYTENDWIVIKKESSVIMRSLAMNMSKDPSDPAVQELIGQWQSHITERFYNCSVKMLAGLGESYVDDVRFAKNINKYGERLSLFFRDAIRVFCK